MGAGIFKTLASVHTEWVGQAGERTRDRISGAHRTSVVDIPQDVVEVGGVSMITVVMRNRKCTIKVTKATKIEATAKVITPTLTCTIRAQHGEGEVVEVKMDFKVVAVATTEEEGEVGMITLQVVIEDLMTMTVIVNIMTLNITGTGVGGNLGVSKVSGAEIVEEEEGGEAQKGTLEGVVSKGEGVEDGVDRGGTEVGIRCKNLSNMAISSHY